MLNNSHVLQHVQYKVYVWKQLKKQFKKIKFY